jgi:hypothetical protein
LSGFNSETQFLYTNLNIKGKNAVKNYKCIEAQFVKKLSQIIVYVKHTVPFLVFYKLLKGATGYLKFASDIDV